MQDTLCSRSRPVSVLLDLPDLRPLRFPYVDDPHYRCEELGNYLHMSTIEQQLFHNSTADKIPKTFDSRSSTNSSALFLNSQETVKVKEV